MMYGGLGGMRRVRVVHNLLVNIEAVEDAPVNWKIVPESVTAVAEHEEIGRAHV